MLSWHSRNGVAPGAAAQSRSDGVGSGSSRRKPSGATGPPGLPARLAWRVFPSRSPSAPGEPSLRGFGQSLLSRPCHHDVDFSGGHALQHFTNEVDVVLHGPIGGVLPVPLQGMNHIGSHSQAFGPCERVPAQRFVDRRQGCLRRLRSLSRAIPVGRAAPRACTRDFSERAAHPAMAAP